MLLSKGYGFANLEWDVAHSPATKFRLGSVTKQFTAASILLLEERGKLKVGDPVKDVSAGCASHVGQDHPVPSAHAYVGDPQLYEFPRYRSSQALPTAVEKTVARFRDKPLDFEPGEKMSYSNSGYVLLGHLIEKITGDSYEQFVQENIFTPLGMKDSGYDSNSAVIRQRAAGYAPSPSGPINAAFVHMSVPHAAGALYSTTEDLLRWEQGLFGGKLLSPASLEKMTTPFKGDYAFGVFVQTRNGRKVVSHGGGIDGFNTELAYYPEEKLTVAVLANLNGPSASEMVPKLGALALGDPVQLTSERKEITLAPTRWRNLSAPTSWRRQST